MNADFEDHPEHEYALLAQETFTRRRALPGWLSPATDDGATTSRRTDPPCSCPFVNGRNAHHDELLRAPTDVAMAIALLELATTWNELDYSGEALVPPVDWMRFAAEHSWPNPDLAHQLFGVAFDVARSRINRPLRAGLRSRYFEGLPGALYGGGCAAAAQRDPASLEHGR